MSSDCLCKKLKNWTSVSSKHLCLVEELKKHRGEIGIGFCHYVEEIKLLESYLSEEGFRVGSYYGGMTLIEREMVIKNMSNLDILLVQIRAGGVGLNLQLASLIFDLRVVVSDTVKPLICVTIIDCEFKKVLCKLSTSSSFCFLFN